MARVKIGARHQVTIPKNVFENLKLEVGDYVDVKVKGDRIELVPLAMIPRDQKWFWSEEWQKKELEADQDIQTGQIEGPFSTAQEAVKALRETDE